MHQYFFFAHYYTSCLDRCFFLLIVCKILFWMRKFTKKQKWGISHTVDGSLTWPKQMWAQITGFQSDTSLHLGFCQIAVAQQLFVRRSRPWPRTSRCEEGFIGPAVADEADPDLKGPSIGRTELWCMICCWRGVRQSLFADQFFVFCLLHPFFLEDLCGVTDSAAPGWSL